MNNRPNILFLMSDEHSFRFMSNLSHEEGGEPCHTPTLDRLAGQGVRFDAAYCPMPLCTPSRMCLFTGLHSHRCGAWGNSHILRPELPTLARTLSQAGYRTATVGKMHLGGVLQHAGFDDRPYGDFGGPCAHQTNPEHEPLGDQAFKQGLRERTTQVGYCSIPESMLQERVAAQESVAWLREHSAANPEQPWMLYASFSRPHFPLTAPKRYFDRYWPNGVTPPRVGKASDAMHHRLTQDAIRGFRTQDIGEEEQMKARAAYFACVDFLDEVLGDMLAQLERDGLLDNTIIIYVSDHGEMAGEHGLWWKNVWHEASTRIPMIISTPAHRRGELAASKVRTPVSLLDMFPTLCAIAGSQTPEGLDGVDISGFIRNETSERAVSRPGAICESFWPRWGECAEFRMIRSERYKYIAFRGCDHMAFDMIEDPDEQHNLVGKATGEVAQELERLRVAVIEGFDFEAVEARRRKDKEELPRLYGMPKKPVTPNQIRLGDGRLVEADTALYYPQVVSSNMAEDYKDYAGKANFMDD